MHHFVTDMKMMLHDTIWVEAYRQAHAAGVAGAQSCSCTEVCYLYSVRHQTSSSSLTYLAIAHQHYILTTCSGSRFEWSSFREHLLKQLAMKQQVPLWVVSLKLLASACAEQAACCGIKFSQARAQDTTCHTMSQVQHCIWVDEGARKC